MYVGAPLGRCINFEGELHRIFSYAMPAVSSSSQHASPPGVNSCVLQADCLQSIDACSSGMHDFKWTFLSFSCCFSLSDGPVCCCCGRCCVLQQYGEAAYWDQRYQREPTCFDWCVAEQMYTATATQLCWLAAAVMAVWRHSCQVASTCKIGHTLQKTLSLYCHYPQYCKIINSISFCSALLLGYSVQLLAQSSCCSATLMHVGCRAACCGSQVSRLQWLGASAEAARSHHFKHPACEHGLQ